MNFISRKSQLIILINFMYFQVGLLVSIISALIPNIIDSYQLNYTIAATLPFAFYISYTFLCIPAGVANEKYSPKNVLLFSFILALTGALLFAIFPNYYASVISLFIIGSSMAIIQVSTVPLLRTICGAENLAFHSTLNQLLYGIGAFLSPNIFSYLTINLLDKNHKHNYMFSLLSKLIPAHFEWIAAYWFFAFLITITLLITVLVKFPQHQKIKVAIERSVYIKLLKNKYVIFYFIALTAYASCEQGIAVWMSKFFQDYHNLNPLTNGASILSWYWILLSLGCIAGMLLLKYFDSRKLLAAFAILALISFTCGLYGSLQVAKIAFPLVGIFESIMWPVILALAINSVSEHHEVLTGFMYTASIGGALGPFVIGSFSDKIGLHSSFQYIYLPLLIVLSVAFWAKPLISNTTIKKHDKPVMA